MRPGQVHLAVYNLIGQEVRLLVDNNRTRGRHQAYWDGKNNVGHPVASGVYIYKLQIADFVESKRMVLMK